MSIFPSGPPDCPRHQQKESEIKKVSNQNYQPVKFFSYLSVYKSFKLYCICIDFAREIQQDFKSQPVKLVSNIQKTVIF